MEAYINQVAKVTGISPRDMFHAFQIVDRLNARDHFSRYDYKTQRSEYIKAKKIVSLYIAGLELIQARMA